MELGGEGNGRKQTGGEGEMRKEREKMETGERKKGRGENKYKRARRAEACVRAVIADIREGTKGARSKLVKTTVQMVKVKTDSR